MRATSTSVRGLVVEGGGDDETTEFLPYLERGGKNG